MHDHIARSVGWGLWMVSVPSLREAPSTSLPWFPTLQPARKWYIITHPTNFPKSHLRSGIWWVIVLKDLQFNFPLNTMCFSKENKSYEKSRWYLRKLNILTFQTSRLVLTIHYLYLCGHLSVFHSVCVAVWVHTQSCSFLYFHFPFPFLFYPWPNEHCSQLIPGLRDLFFIPTDKDCASWHLVHTTS